MTSVLDALLNSEVQQYIVSHENADEKNIVLRQQLIFGVAPADIAQQIAGRRKSKEKLPLFFNTPNILYPPSINLEQCSSEATARLKVSLLSDLNVDHRKGADLTGGFGVDAFFLSQLCAEFYYIEPDAVLVAIVKNNHMVLGASVRHVQASAENFIGTTNDQYSFLYIDPSRRKGTKKVFLLSDCEPNVPAFLDQLFSKTNIILIKTSPLLDLQQGVRELAHVKKIVVIAVRNECREVLFLCDNTFDAEPEIACINLLAAGAYQEFKFKWSDERIVTSSFSNPLKYLYEPNAAILKGGAFKHIGSSFGLKKIQQHTHLYTSDTHVENFPGRVFLVDTINPPQKSLKNFFPDGKANVVTRNYPLTAEALKKKWKLQDGGEKFLIGFSGWDKKFLAVATRVH